MSKQDDIRLVIEQEKALVFPEFDEAIAFKLGSALRDAALAGKYGIVADVRTWDRPLFYMALPGTTGDNPNWVRRKANLVQTVMKSSYRVVLEKSWPEDYFPPRRGLDNMEVVLAGGSFPIRVKGAGMIGAITASGLHERDDHRVVVDVICDHLGLDKKAFTLPPL
ncbi:MAG: heme-degrading domain-containing protein [Devosia sp.]